MKIVTYPDPVLKLNLNRAFLSAKGVGRPSDALITEMVDAMYIGDGVGLAAPQVGVEFPMFVMDPSGGNRSDELAVVLQPAILDRSGETEDDVESCLSLPGISGTVSRARSIVVQYTQPNGLSVQRALEGFAARVFQHEFDHLEGILYVDRVPTFSRKLLLRDYAKLRTT